MNKTGLLILSMTEIGEMSPTEYLSRNRKKKLDIGKTSLGGILTSFFIK